MPNVSHILKINNKTVLNLLFNLKSKTALKLKYLKDMLKSVAILDTLYNWRNRMHLTY